MKIVIEPAPRATESGQNRRGNWARGHRADLAAKQVTAAAVLKALGGKSAPGIPPDAGMAVRITWSSPNRSWLPDRANYASILKSHLDEIALKLGFNDRRIRRIDFGEERTGKEVKSMVEIEVTQL